MLKTGQVIKVLGYRGVSWPTELAKVVAVRDIHAKPLKMKTYWYNRITRSPVLVTVEYAPHDDEKEPIYRSYYTEFLLFKQVTTTWRNRLLGWWNS